MEAGTIGDYISSFIGAFLLFIGIFLIPEIRKKKKYWIPILILVAILLVIGINKINRDDTLKVKNEQKFDSLNNTINEIKNANDKLIAKHLQDSLKNVDFQEKLFKEFKITRDSATNRPIINNYTTNIKEAKEVKIGGN